MSDLIEQATQSIVDKVAPEDREPLSRIVKAGMKFLYAPQTNDMVHKALTEGAPEDSIAKGAPIVMAILVKESKGTLPPQLLIPAAFAIAFDALDYLAETQGFEVTPDLLDKVTYNVGQSMLAAAGVKPEDVERLHGEAQDILKDPKNKAAYDARQGA
jgi:hypothetical protein